MATSRRAERKAMAAGSMESVRDGLRVLFTSAARSPLLNRGCRRTRRLRGRRGASPTISPGAAGRSQHLRDDGRHGVAAARLCSCKSFLQRNVKAGLIEGKAGGINASVDASEPLQSPFSIDSAGPPVFDLCAHFPVERLNE